jgi:hypothetical protein
MAVVQWLDVSKAPPAYLLYAIMYAPVQAKADSMFVTAQVALAWAHIMPSKIVTQPTV